MSLTARITGTVTFPGVTFSTAKSRTAEGGAPQSFPLPAGKAGAISAAGVDGLLTGHGLVQGNIVDVHWTDPGSGAAQCRRGVTIDSAAANAVTFDNSPAAEGDAVPAEDTPVVVSLQVAAECFFDGDTAVALAVRCDKAAVCDIRLAADSALVLPLAAGEAWTWFDGDSTNPLAGKAVASITASAATTQGGTLLFSALLDTVA